MNIYVNSIVGAVHTIISSWDAAVNSGWNVCLNDEYNTDANLTPWIGIYSPTITFNPMRANIYTPFTAELRLPVFTQETDLREPSKAIALLETLTGEVYTAVSCYRDLLGSVNIVKGIEWNPYSRIVEDEDVLVTNELVIIAEVFA